MNATQKLLRIQQHPNYEHCRWKNGKINTAKFTREIASEFECSVKTVLSWLDDNNEREPGKYFELRIDQKYRNLNLDEGER